MDKKVVMKRLKEQFGDRMGLLAHSILGQSTSDQPCDVLFYKKKPALDVEIDSNISLALLYGRVGKPLNFRVADGPAFEFPGTAYHRES
jgi:hypothetical protein